jgi:molybdopterin synthase sulfur carrier subunit
MRGPGDGGTNAEAAAATVRVLLFAGLRQRAGWGERPWPHSDGLTPHQIWSQLADPAPAHSVRVAINHSFASFDTPLKPNDELAFLPPISGG